MTAAKWLPFCLLLAGCVPNSDMPDPEPASSADAPGAIKNLAYGEGPQRVLDLYVPEGTKGEPLVVFVHGGAWQSGSRHEYDAVCANFMKSGIAAATVDYRLSPTVAHPAHATDVAEALAWLGKKASEYGYDPARIFIVGHSAGGHIAATIATDAKLLPLAKPAGFVGLEGIYDVPDLAERWPSYPDWFLKKAFGADSTRWPEASPTRQKLVSKSPWLVVHSKADELVDMGQAEAFAKHLEDSGIKSKLLRVEDKKHFDVVNELAKPDDEVTKAIVEFVSAG